MLSVINSIHGPKLVYGRYKNQNTLIFLKTYYFKLLKGVIKTFIIISRMLLVLVIEHV